MKLQFLIGWIISFMLVFPAFNFFVGKEQAAAKFDWFLITCGAVSLALAIILFLLYRILVELSRGNRIG